VTDTYITAAQDAKSLWTGNSFLSATAADSGSTGQSMNAQSSDAKPQMLINAEL